MRIPYCYQFRVAILLSLMSLLILMVSVTTFAQTQPTLMYKIGIGATGLRSAFTVASSIDTLGNSYLAFTKANNSEPQCPDVVVQKVDASGANIIYRLTVSNCNFVRGVASDPNGNAYVLLDSSITRISPDGSEVINAWAWTSIVKKESRVDSKER